MSGARVFLASSRRCTLVLGAKNLPEKYKRITRAQCKAAHGQWCLSENRAVFCVSFRLQIITGFQRERTGVTRHVYSAYSCSSMGARVCELRWMHINHCCSIVNKHSYGCLCRMFTNSQPLAARLQFNAFTQARSRSAILSTGRKAHKNAVNNSI